MSEFLMKPKIDFCFKELMMDEQIRKGFLSAVLHLKPEEIEKTEILNTNLRRLTEDEKQGILDVRIRLNNQVEIDIEIQLAAIKAWAERALFYLAKMYVEQIKPGDDYNVLKRCVSISILDFKLFKEAQKSKKDTESKEDPFYSCFHLREDERDILYTDKLEFHVLELPKLPEKLKENCGDIELWGKFISAERKEDFEMLAGRNVYIDNAYHHLQVISQDKDKRMEYEAREKAIRDYNQGIIEAREEGRNEGIGEGLRIFVEDQIEDGIPKEKIIEKLQKRGQMSLERAKQIYEKYAN